MQIRRSDILGHGRYEPIRDDYRRRVMTLKKPRRIHVGDRVTLVFENLDTLKFQVEEMVRAESLTTDAQIQAEIDVYNSMMPSPDELSATLFLELARDEDARKELHRFIGIDEHVKLVIGEHSVPAHFEEGRQEGDRISAVQYTRFKLNDQAKQALGTPGTRLAIEIDHPSYKHRTELSEETRASLARDLG